MCIAEVLERGTCHLLPVGHSNVVGVSWKTKFLIGLYCVVCIYFGYKGALNIRT